MMSDGKAGKKGLIAATIFGAMGGAVAAGIAAAVLTKAAPRIMGTMQEMMVHMQEN